MVATVFAHVPSLSLLLLSSSCGGVVITKDDSEGVAVAVTVAGGVTDGVMDGVCKVHLKHSDGEMSVSLHSENI